MFRYNGQYLTKNSPLMSEFSNILCTYVYTILKYADFIFVYTQISISSYPLYIVVAVALGAYCTNTVHG